MASVCIKGEWKGPAYKFDHGFYGRCPNSTSERAECQMFFIEVLDGKWTQERLASS